MCRRPRRIIIIAKGGEEGLKKGVVVVRVTKSRLPFDDHHPVNDVNDDFDERGFGTGIGNMHHLKYNGQQQQQQQQQQRRFDDVFWCLVLCLKKENFQKKGKKKEEEFHKP